MKKQDFHSELNQFLAWVGQVVMGNLLYQTEINNSDENKIYTENSSRIFVNVCRICTQFH